MADDSDLIFERYIQYINEAFMPWKHGRKAAAGLGKKTLVRHETQIRLKDEVREQQIQIALQYGTVVNVLNALAEKFYKNNTKKVKQLMADYTGVGNPNVKTMFNPLEYGLPPYTIPLYDIPNRILSVRARYPEVTGYTIDKNLQRNLLKNYYQLLCDIYRERGGNPDDVNELNLVLSYPTRIHHEFKKWGDVHRDVLRPQIFGGQSEADKNNEFVHITNVRELKGKNWERLNKEEKIGNLLFWGDPRTPESKYDTTYKPESSKTPENIATSVGEFKPKPKRKTKPKSSTTETKKKKPTKKKEIKKESYQPFIRIIPF